MICDKINFCDLLKLSTKNKIRSLFKSVVDLI